MRCVVAHFYAIEAAKIIDSADPRHRPFPGEGELDHESASFPHGIPTAHTPDSPNASSKFRTQWPRISGLVR